MLRRAWQAGMIALTRSSVMEQTMQDARGASALAARYVADESPEAGVSLAAALLMQHKLHSSLFYLGEYVDRPVLVRENVAAKFAVVERHVISAGPEASIYADLQACPTRISATAGR